MPPFHERKKKGGGTGIINKTINLRPGSICQKK
jgi:hypothetical protein